MTATIRDWSGDVHRAQEGTLYPARHRMKEAGWIRAEWIKQASGRRIRAYTFTATGKKRLAVEETGWEAVTSAVNQVLRMD